MRLKTVGSPVQFWTSALAMDAPIACGSGSVVEHLLAKERVAGSNPVFRLFWRRSQVVKAGVCKTPTIGSSPIVALCIDLKDFGNP